MSIERRNNPTPPVNQILEITNQEKPKNDNLLPSGEHIEIIKSPTGLMTYEKMLDYYANNQSIEHRLGSRTRQNNSEAYNTTDTVGTYGETSFSYSVIQLTSDSPKQLLVLRSQRFSPKSNPDRKQLSHTIRLYSGEINQTYLPQNTRLVIYAGNPELNIHNTHKDKFLGNPIKEICFVGPYGELAEVNIQEKKVFCRFPEEISKMYNIPTEMQGKRTIDKNGKPTNGFDYQESKNLEKANDGSTIMKYDIILQGQIVGQTYHTDPNRFLETTSRNADNWMQFEFFGKMEEPFHVAIGINYINPETGNTETRASIIHNSDILKNPTFYS